MPTLLYKDVFANFKLKAIAVLTLSHAHGFPLKHFQFLRIILGLPIGLKADSEEGEVFCLYM